MKNLILAFIAISMLSACEYIPKQADLETRNPLPGKLAKKFYQFYDGVPAPPMIEKEDYEVIKSTNLKTYQKYKAKMAKLFEGENYSEDEKDILIYYAAVADHDHDGKSDWFYSESSNMLKPYDDRDIDNDGIENFLDANPFDSSVTYFDLNGNGIPDHIDFSENGIDSKTSAKQLELFNKYGIYAINQTDKLNHQTIDALMETLELTFGSVINQNIDKDGKRTFPGFKYYTAEKSDPDSGTMAYFRKDLDIITVTSIGLPPSTSEYFNSPKNAQFFMTLIHEMAHALHRHLENVSPNRVENEFLNHFWKDGKFRGLPKDQWEDKMIAEMNKAIGEFNRTRDRRAIDYFYDLIDFENVKGYDLKSEENFRNKHWTSTLVARRNDIISRYSLTSPAEYFAEAVVSYTYRVMIRARFARFSKEHVRKKVHLIEKIVKRRSINTGNEMSLTNIPEEGIDFLDSVLELSDKIVWDAKAKATGARKAGLYLRAD